MPRNKKIIIIKRARDEDKIKAIPRNTLTLPAGATCLERIVVYELQIIQSIITRKVRLLASKRSSVEFRASSCRNETR